MRVRFSFGAIAKLKRHTFPGNIRELRNIVARAKAYAGSSEIAEADIDQLVDVTIPPLTPPARLANKIIDLQEYRPSRSVLREIELEMIKTRLIANRGNQRKTAADLGMPKSTLHDRLRSYGIDVDKLLADR
jgi:DNA-binding NtrC family response regulator